MTTLRSAFHKFLETQKWIHPETIPPANPRIAHKLESEQSIINLTKLPNSKKGEIILIMATSNTRNFYMTLDSR